MDGIARMRMIYRQVRGKSRLLGQRGSLDSDLALDMLESDGHGHLVVADPADPKLDYITRLAVQATGADIGGVSLMFQTQLWLPSSVGVDARLVPRAGSFCNVTVQEDGEMFEVPDARRDPRFADNFMVTGAPHYVHYAGVRLRSERQHLLGTLWVLSTRPGTLEPAQASQLRLLARIVADLIELRYCDQVTGMFNRAVFLQHLQHLIDDDQGSKVTVGMIDLIGFRQVNDLFRREAGDRILRLMADRLVAWDGGSLLGHLGADKFVFALGSATPDHDAHIARLCSIIDQPFEIEPGNMHVLHARIGVRHQALPCVEEAADLLDAADVAASSIRTLHESSTVQTYDAELIARARLRYELRETIRGAQRFGRLEVHYQPQVDFAAGCLIGLEALVRWRHPVYGLVGPAMFVPQAEHSGRIFDLDLHVLELVCHDLMAWRARGLEVAPVALNFSRASLMHSDIFARLADVLEATGVPGDLLEFEVTESLLLDSQQLLHQRVSALRALGVRVAVDDFGTGYSNLDALTSFPFDRLKADRQFVHGVASDARTAGVFALIQGIAAVFDAELLCEGLEDEADLSWLAERGVHCVQGWYFSRARPGPAIERVLERFQDARKAQLSVPELRALLA